VLLPSLSVTMRRFVSGGEGRCAKDRGMRLLCIKFNPAFPQALSRRCSNFVIRFQTLKNIARCAMPLVYRFSLSIDCYAQLSFRWRGKCRQAKGEVQFNNENQIAKKMQANFNHGNHSHHKNQPRWQAGHNSASENLQKNGHVQSQKVLRKSCYGNR
jgi:predicted secreted protein